MKRTSIRQLSDGCVRVEYVEDGEWRTRHFEIQDKRGHVCERDYGDGYVYSFICRGLSRGNYPPLRVSAHDTLLDVIRDEWKRRKHIERKACTNIPRG